MLRNYISFIYLEKLRPFIQYVKKVKYVLKNIFIFFNNDSYWKKCFLYSKNFSNLVFSVFFLLKYESVFFHWSLKQWFFIVQEFSDLFYGSLIKDNVFWSNPNDLENLFCAWQKCIMLKKMGNLSAQISANFHVKISSMVLFWNYLFGVGGLEHLFLNIDLFSFYANILWGFSVFHLIYRAVERPFYDWTS